MVDPTSNLAIPAALIQRLQRIKTSLAAGTRTSLRLGLASTCQQLRGRCWATANWGECRRKRPQVCGNPDNSYIYGFYSDLMGFSGDLMGFSYISGWWHTYPSEKYEFVSWDDDIPKIWKNKKVTNHQPDIHIWVMASKRKF